MLRAKSKSFLEAEWFTFGPESGRVEATVSELALKFETMAILLTVTDAKFQGQMEKHQIVNIRRNGSSDFQLCYQPLKDSGSNNAWTNVLIFEMY